MMEELTLGEIQGWFKLENYSDKNLGSGKGEPYERKLWRRQLKVREYIDHILDDKQIVSIIDDWGGQDPTQEDKLDWSKITTTRQLINKEQDQLKRDRLFIRKEYLPIIQKTPVLDEKAENLILNQKRDGQRFISWAFDQRTVYSTPAGHIYDFDNRNHTRLREKASLAIKQKIHDGVIEKPKSVCLDAFIDSMPINYHRLEAGWDELGKFTNVTVDLRATNDEIIKDFGLWLTAYREAMGYQSEHIGGKKKSKQKLHFNSKIFKEWRESKLLPLIDLRLMAKAEGKIIKPETIAAMLYTDEYEDADEQTKKNLCARITETGIPKADALLSQKVLDALNIKAGRD
jgi:hypothetical protein